MKKIGRKLLSATALIVFAAAVLLQENLAVKAAPENGETVPQGYTPVYDIGGLYGINDDLSGKYILMNDIDLSETAPGGAWDSGNGWKPIGADDYDGFSGELDGNGFHIKNMNIYGSLEGNNAGLFSKLKYAQIRNVGLTDCSVSVRKSGGMLCIGGIAGTANAEITGCFVTGKIEDLSESLDGFGLRERSHYIGGIAGYQDIGMNDIENCYSAADLDAASAAEFGYSVCSIGGILGGAYDISSLQCSSCYSAGNISGLAGQDAGGICGKGGGEGNALYYRKTSVSGTGLNEWGTALTDFQMKNEKAFTGFDFADIWYIDELSGYYFPQLRSCIQERIVRCELTSLPEKLEYDCGEELDLTAGVLTVSYENGMKSDVALENDMVSGYDTDTPGMQTLTASYADSRVSFEVKVREVPAESLNLDHKKYELDRGGKFQLTASFLPENATYRNLAWETDNELVAAVSEDGEVKGINAGTAVITAETHNGIKASCIVTVKAPAQKLKLSVTKLQLKKGQKKTIKAVMTPLDSADKVTWMSSSPEIASVNSKGVVKAKKQGSAVIMAKTSSGISKKVQVTVINNKQDTGNVNKSQAEKLLVIWLKKNNLYNKKYLIVYERKEGEKYVFHYYEDMPDHIATVNFYYVHSRTGRITAMF